MFLILTTQNHRQYALFPDAMQPGSSAGGQDRLKREKRDLRRAVEPHRDVDRAHAAADEDGRAVAPACARDNGELAEMYLTMLERRFEQAGLAMPHLTSVYPHAVI